MKTRILKMLRNSKGYVSGQQLCNELGVSRTAVWKCINQLKDMGYVIEAVQNKGYRVLEYPDIINEVEICSLLEEDNIFYNKVYYFDEVDSTNNEAKRKAELGAKDGSLVVAESQTSGKGRRGKQWTSSKGSGIWMTLIRRPDIMPYSASMITLITAMATAKAINNVCNIACSIKWPNDIIVNAKKVTGILTEMSAEPDQVNYVVIGVGINVNTQQFPDDIKDKATSLIIETGCKVSRSHIIAEFLKQFDQYYNSFLRTGDLSEILDEYNSMLINCQKEVRVIGVKDEFTGVALGINEKGELIVRKEADTLVNVMAGEVSVRGVYGYV